MANKTNLPNLGRAPNFAGITAWFNTPGNKPLTLSQLRGKVVLIDFWTYSCINCQRALPHVEGWYNDYKKDGLVVVGVSAPEFAFEHVVSNVVSAAGSLGIDYPVAVDDNLATWDAYNNEYWPADYLIDGKGRVRYHHFGEGSYAETETSTSYESTSPERLRTLRREIVTGYDVFSMFSMKLPIAYIPDFLRWTVVERSA